MTNKIRVGGLRGIMMRGPNMIETLPFYEQMWGLQLAHIDQGCAYLRGNADEAFIYGLKDSSTYGIEYIHFSMPNKASIYTLFEQVKKESVVIFKNISKFDDYIGGYGFEILDPDNRRLRFRYGGSKVEPQSEWAKPKKISHVVLNTPNMDKTQKFYEEVLGFRVSDYSADQMVFLRSGSDHHSIALVRAQYASVNHVAFELSSINEFMRSIGRMKQNGHLPSWGPGRHRPGDNPFAYFISPSGFVIEFTSEVLQIDEQKHEAKVWSREKPELMDTWMTSGPPTNAQRTVMAGRPDPGFSSLDIENK